MGKPQNTANENNLGQYLNRRSSHDAIDVAEVIAVYLWKRSRLCVRAYREAQACCVYMREHFNAGAKMQKNARWRTKKLLFKLRLQHIG